MPGWNSEFNDDFDLNSFEPLPSIHEHETFSLKSFPSQHDYGNLINTGADDNFDNGSIDTKRNSTRLIHLQSDRWLQTSIAGDSIQLRIILVLVTYLVAALVPNVENLISLAGALAGSSTALLIPPIMELAWIRDMQKPDMPERNSTMYDMNESASWFLAVGREDKFFYEKMKSWILFFLGLFFAAVGTYASINDIIRVSQESSYTNQIDDVQT
jgi:proton-coupled amino acid transporter